MRSDLSGLNKKPCSLSRLAENKEGRLQAMDVRVHFPDGSDRVLQLPANSTVGDALTCIAAALGLDSSFNRVLMSEWGLALHRGRGAAERWINTLWLDYELPLGPFAKGSSSLLFGKKLYTGQEKTILNHTLWHMQYHQLLEIHTSGKIFCSGHKTACLAALAAHIETANCDYLPSSSSWLRNLLPPRLQKTPGMIKAIMRQMRKIGHSSVQGARIAFVKGMRQLETCDLSLYTAKMEDIAGVLGIGARNIFWMDKETYEPVIQWPMDRLTSCQHSASTVTMVVGGEQFTVETKFGPQISQCVNEVSCLSATSQVASVPSTPILAKPQTQAFHRYTLETGADGGEESEDVTEGVTVVPVRANRLSVDHQLSETEDAILSSPTADSQNEQEEVEEEHVSKRAKETSSPIIRNGERRRAFRRRDSSSETQEPRREPTRYKPLLHIPVLPSSPLTPEMPPALTTPIVRDIDTVEELSRIMGSNFRVELKWGERDNPVYDTIVGPKVDSTLRKTRITYSSLTETLRCNMRRTSGSKVSLSDIDRMEHFQPSLVEMPEEEAERQPTTRLGKRSIYNDMDDLLNTRPCSPVQHAVLPSSPDQPPVQNPPLAQKPPVPEKPLVPEKPPVPEKPRRPSFPERSSRKKSSCTSVFSEDGTVMSGFSRRPSGSSSVMSKDLVVFEDEDGDKDFMVPQRLGMMHPRTPGPRARAPGEVLRDYSAVKREFRMFFVKLPNGQMHLELASLYQPIHKLVSRLCVLVHADNPSKYELFVEGAVLGQTKDPEMSSEILDDLCTPPREHTPSPSAQQRQENKLKSILESAVLPRNYLLLPAQPNQAVLLDQKLNFKDQGIVSSRILALRPIAGHRERLPVVPVKVPDWVRFHQSWLSVVQGNHPCSLQDAITLAATLYQAYVLDRTEINSVIGFCNARDFLPAEYANINGIERKILQERESLLSYTREQLEQVYCHGVSSLPSNNMAFFPCKEPQRHFFKGKSKMRPVLLGIGKEGVMRVDAKSKQVLDVWSYEVVRNWGHTKSSFLLAFEKSTYPVKTNQGYWMVSLINFHIDSIMKSRGMFKSCSSDSLRSGVSTRYSSPSGSLASRRVPVASHHNYFLLEEERTGPSHSDDMMEEDVRTDEEELRMDQQAGFQEEAERRSRHELVDESQRSPTDRRTPDDDAMETQYRPDANEEEHSMEEDKSDEVEDSPPVPPHRTHLKYQQLEDTKRKLQRQRELLAKSVPKYQSEMIPQSKALPRGQAPQQYYQLEKVYEELLLVRAQLQNFKQQRNLNGLADGIHRSSSPTVAARAKPVPAPRQRDLAGPLYVNPKADCSLINPDARTRSHMQSLGLTPQESVSSDVTSSSSLVQYDEVFEDVVTKESLSPVMDAETEDEDSDYDDIFGQSELIPDDDDEDYDDVIYRNGEEGICD